jgi:hypothetical protein
MIPAPVIEYETWEINDFDSEASLLPDQYQFPDDYIGASMSSNTSVCFYLSNMGYITELESVDVTLKRRIPFKIVFEDNFYYLKQDELGIYEGASEYGEAKSALVQYILDDFRNWIQTPDGELSERAKGIFEAYKKYLEYHP